MSSKKKYKIKKKITKVKEPVSPYKNASIEFFNSFREMEEAGYRKVLKKEPIERVRETVELILRMYGLTRAQLKKRKRSNKIKFISKNEFIY